MMSVECGVRNGLVLTMLPASDRMTIEMDNFDKDNDWERLLSAQRHIQALVAGTVLVGGTAAALHGHHRVSLDGNHVLEDLRERYDQVLADLEAAAGWQTERTQRPVLILGRMDGVLTGIRQLRRTRPLETELIYGLRVPTLSEMARIKAWLLATRHTLRDYLDTVVLLERLKEEGAAKAFKDFDSIYAQPTGASPLSEVVERLRAAKPKDYAAVELATYRNLIPPWNEWQYLKGRGRHWAVVLVRVVLAARPKGEENRPMNTEASKVADLDFLSRSQALWNRNALDLQSDAVIGQILDRGTVEDWRALYRLAQAEHGDEVFARQLRQRILKVVGTIPLPLPNFWLAALESLPRPPELSELDPPLPPYPAEADI